MKKLLFMFATAALVLSACSSEDDIVQGGGSPAQLGASGALGFDVYTASATKAGDPTGVMNTEKLKTENKGFGVYATYQDQKTYAELSDPEKVPNFMFNEHVSWTAAGGWTYSPLKYWPNETLKDSQSPAATGGETKADMLSFFAYAPYVALTTPGEMTVNKSTSAKANAYVEATPSTGILAITRESNQGDPLVEWKTSTDLDKNVDLLWGVAPNGMAYQSVNPDIYINKTFGLPLLDLVKPDKDQKIKFLFNHALSRIGLSVVSAVDQIAAGDDGGKFNNLQTRVLVKSVEVYGTFGKQGVLNLNNTQPNVAKWIAESIDADNATSPLFTFDSRQDGSTGNGYIAPDLRYVNSQISGVTGAADAAAAATAFSALNTGVLPSEQTLLAGDADPNKMVGTAASTPAFTFGKVYYKAIGGSDKGYEVASLSHTNSANLFIKDDSGNYTQVYTTTDASITLDGNSPTYYELTTGSAATAALTADAYYYKEGTIGGKKTYTKIQATGGETDWSTVNYYPESGFSGDATTVSETYASAIYYTGLIPRYFMVIPTGNTDIKVKITYAVVTYDEKLGDYSTNVQNAITKTTSLILESGKSYNLKLILGLTSVKLDATVADWQVDGSNEVYLPQNNE